MAYINWKKARPTSLQEAFWLVKKHGMEKKNLSVPRIAELMGLDDESILYKWMKQATMPINKIASFEHVCGANYVSIYLASSDNKLLIDIPTGKNLEPVSVLEMQTTFNHAITLLMKCAAGNATADETVAALTSSMSDLAYHRENVQKQESPELDFGLESDND
ncbi:MAG: hypothetical protein U9N57_07380 [Pseudomonadota bacterium]|nr:hypothetical protein [Pseudomonadota bacterium]